jgi:hypothetical protein
VNQGTPPLSQRQVLALIRREVANLLAISTTQRKQKPTTSEIPDNSISTSKLQNLAVTSAKLGLKSVNGTTHIQSGTISSDLLSNEIISNQKLATNSVDFRVLADNSVDRAAIVNFAVGQLQLEDGSITNQKLDAASVSSATLQTDSVSTFKVQNGSITFPKLANDIVISDFASIHYFGGTFIACLIDGTPEVSYAPDTTVSFNQISFLTPSFDIPEYGVYMINLHVIASAKDDKCLLIGYKINAGDTIWEPFDGSKYKDADNATFKHTVNCVHIVEIGASSVVTLYYRGAEGGSEWTLGSSYLLIRKLL